MSPIRGRASHWLIDRLAEEPGTVLFTGVGEGGIDSIERDLDLCIEGMELYIFSLPGKQYRQMHGIIQSTSIEPDRLAQESLDSVARHRGRTAAAKEDAVAEGLLRLPADAESLRLKPTAAGQKGLDLPPLLEAQRSRQLTSVCWQCRLTGVCVFWRDGGPGRGGRPW